MEWTELEAHFRAATKQRPCEHGDDAIEWDHSRYSRALGLVGDESLQQLKRSGLALLSAEATSWRRAVERYRSFADDAGWSLLRISARPTVAVPDPVIHALGTAVSGADGLIFLRSGRSGRPRVFPGRVRPEGASLPLAPVDRWLIAADRVRRRMRNEIAVRGILLVIEDAHKLTASAMSVLSYLIDAHCAWQARMLARDARVYVVLSTPPEHEASVVGMLERFSYGDDVHVARDRPTRVATPRPNGFDVEEEHLLSALRDAPLALTEDDIASIFGESARETATRLVERGAACRRREDGHVCVVPMPTGVENMPVVPQRVTRGIFNRYRERVRRGHEHLMFAMAALAFRLGEPLRALGILGRLAPGNTATIALDLQEEIEGYLATDSIAAWLKGGHVAMCVCLRAHQRDYKSGQELATRLTKMDLRSPADFGRVLAFLLSCGRTHTDEVLAPEFWASLRSSRVDPALFDAACIFAELELRVRHMSGREIADRYRVASECLEGARTTSDTRPARSNTRASVLGILETTRSRIRGMLILHYRDRVGDTETVADGCPMGSEVLPGYLIGSAWYGHHYAGGHSSVEANPHLSIAFATEFLRCTGNCQDSLICMGAWLRKLVFAGLALLARQCADEIVLLVPRRASFAVRYRVGRTLGNVAGRRTRLLTSAALATVNRRNLNERVRDGSLECASLSRDLLSHGDFPGASIVLQGGLGSSHRYPVRLVNLLQLHTYSVLQTLAWQDLDVSRAMADRYRPTIPSWLFRILESYTEGASLLTQRKADRAATLLEAAAREARGSRSVCHALSGALCELLVIARRLAMWRGSLCRASTDRARLKSFSRLFLSPAVPGTEANVGSRIPDGLFAVVMALEEWANAAWKPSQEQAVLLALWLKRRVGRTFKSSGQDLFADLMRCAPTYVEQLAKALPDLGGGTPLDASLATVEHVWGDPAALLAETVASLSSYTVTIRARGSTRRLARAAAVSWPEDASVYSFCVKKAADGGPVPVSCFGLHEGSRLGAGVTLNTHRHGDRVVVSTKSGRDSQFQCRPRRSPEIATVDTQVRLPRTREPTAFVGSSEAADEVRDLISVAARCEYPVLIEGETGTGKEVVARSIHLASTRRRGALVVADCGATTESLLESELFGHRRGAFTGAHEHHQGMIQRAHGSTLFLDEVDSMTTRMQASLLRVLETGEYRPVGSAQHEWADFRVIAASLPGLRELVDSGSFREDLYYRLSTLCIRVIPLRHREGDAAEIANHYTRRRGRRISAPGLAAIEEYGWPGNVRQLQHCLDLACLTSADTVIGLAAIEQAIGNQARLQTGPQRVAHTAAQKVWQGVVSDLADLTEFTVLDFVRVAAVSRRSAQRYLATLVRVGLVRRHGAGRATVYTAAGGGRF